MYTSILNLLSDIGVLSACVRIGTLDAEGFDFYGLLKEQPQKTLLQKPCDVLVGKPGQVG